jgi:hypothetical protein
MSRETGQVEHVDVEKIVFSLFSGIAVRKLMSEE